MILWDNPGIINLSATVFGHGVEKGGTSLKSLEKKKGDMCKARCAANCAFAIPSSKSKAIIWQTSGRADQEKGNLGWYFARSIGRKSR
jgi:hypothetical protein